MGQKFTNSQLIRNNPQPIYNPRDGFDASHNLPSASNDQYFKLFEFDGGTAGSAYDLAGFVIEIIARHYIAEWTISFYTDATGTSTSIDLNKIKYRQLYTSGTVYPVCNILTAGQIFTGIQTAGHVQQSIYRLKNSNGGLSSTMLRGLTFFDTPVSTTDPGGTGSATRVVW